MRAWKLGPIAALAFNLAAPAAGQQVFSPPWADQYPTRLEPGQIGVVAAMSERPSFACMLDVGITNGTEQTIRMATFAVEVFFGEHSEVTTFAVQLADPDRMRIAQMVVPVACQHIPTRIVFRTIEMCQIGASLMIRNCAGARFIALAPSAPVERRFVRVEFAPDFGR